MQARHASLNRNGRLVARRRRRQVRRRRAAALVTLCLAIALSALLYVSLHSQPSGSQTRHDAVSASSARPKHTPAAARPHKAHSRLVRNARPQPGWRPHTGPVPILVYHALGDPPPGAPYPGLYVSKTEFAAQMRWLAQHGYQGVTLDEVMHAWYRHGTLPPKPIVITFDNGYPAQATFAPTVLSRYGWPGVLNEITVGHLAPKQIWPLIRIGWEIDSHSLTHPDLTTLSPDELREQVAASRRFLQRTFHIPVNSFCYPSSRYDSSVIAAVRAAGYSNATTETPGYASRARPFELNRYEIERGQGVTGLAADLNDHD
jgi:peptidoglycan/xylan/chitin deacetylase (PgdA/CDA1 family)